MHTGGVLGETGPEAQRGQVELEESRWPPTRKWGLEGLLVYCGLNVIREGVGMWAPGAL